MGLTQSEIHRAENAELRSTVSKYVKSIKMGRPLKRKQGKKKVDYLSYSKSTLAFAIISYLSKEFTGEEAQRQFGVPRQTIVMHCTNMGLKQKRDRSEEERKKLKAKVEKYINERSQS